MTSIGKLEINGEAYALKIDNIPSKRTDVPRTRIALRNALDRDKYPQSFVIMHIKPEKTVFAGMQLRPELQGMKLGDVLVEICFRISEIIGIPLTETSVIRKPIIAKVIREFGFSPRSEGILMELLPYRKGDDYEVPNLRVLQKPENTVLEMSSEAGLFYRLMSDGVAQRFPSPSVAPIALQTDYVLEDMEQHKQKRVSLRERIRNTLKIDESCLKNVLNKL